MAKGKVVVDETPDRKFLRDRGAARWIDATAKKLGVSRRITLRRIMRLCFGLEAGDWECGGEMTFGQCGRSKKRLDAVFRDSRAPRRRGSDSKGLSHKAVRVTRNTVHSALRAVALLVFLAGAAGAGIVAAHFFLTSNDLLHCGAYRRPGHASLFQLAALAAHEGFFQFVGGGRDHRGMPSVAVPIHACCAGTPESGP
jgi:uncharacterized MAPEG superfamily protein